MEREYQSLYFLNLLPCTLLLPNTASKQNSNSSLLVPKKGLLAFILGYGVDEMIQGFAVGHQDGSLSGADFRRNRRQFTQPDPKNLTSKNAWSTANFKLFSLFMVRWQWHGQLPCPSEGKAIEISTYSWTWSNWLDFNLVDISSGKR